MSGARECGQYIPFGREEIIFCVRIKGHDGLHRAHVSGRNWVADIEWDYQATQEENEAHALNCCGEGVDYCVYHA